MGYPISRVYTKQSHAFWSVNNQYCSKTALSPVLIKCKNNWHHDLLSHSALEFRNLQGTSIMLQVWLVGLFYGKGTLVPRGALQLGFLWDFPLLNFFPFFQISYYSSTIFLVLLLPIVSLCCSYARGTLRGMHTSCMGSPFSASPTTWSHVEVGSI